MSLKQFWAKTGRRLYSQKSFGGPDYQPQVDEEGLMYEQDMNQQQTQDEHPENTASTAKAVQQSRQEEQIEKLQGQFNRLIEQLEQINTNLGRQIAQQDDLIKRIEKLPGLLESLPASIENQRTVIEQLIARLEATDARNQHFINSVDQIPQETARQTDTLVNINHQLAAAADMDVQMAESLNNFNEALARLEQTTAQQSESIMQMNKTFAASDRYLKYLIWQHNRRFLWVLLVALGICTIVVLILAGIIMLLRQPAA